jgi:uncharacterized protein YecE (DUF72 family)
MSILYDRQNHVSRFVELILILPQAASALILFKYDMVLYMDRAWIGTSGWSYKGWAKSFYPEEITGVKQFTYYASQFPTVELNASFYRTPTENAVKSWHDKSPSSFIIAVKGSRYVTHIKRLKDVEESVRWFCDRMAPLGEHLGPFLWQLPPNFKKDITRLEQFLTCLPKHFRHAVEFRDPSWIEDETFETLSRYHVAFVAVSSLRMPQDFTLTTDFTYVRFHGLEGGAAHDYSKEELQPWAIHLQEALGEGRSVYAYFNNDINTRAPENAKLLQSLIEEEMVQQRGSSIAMASSAS